MRYLVISLIDSPQLLGRVKDQFEACPMFELLLRHGSTIFIEGGKIGDNVIAVGNDDKETLVGVIVPDEVKG